MPPALAAKSSFPGSVANLHPVGNTANLPKWLVWQYLRLGWLGHQHPRVIDRPVPELVVGDHDYLAPTQKIRRTNILLNWNLAT